MNPLRMAVGFLFAPLIAAGLMSWEVPEAACREEAPKPTPKTPGGQAVPSETMAKLVADNNRFAFDLYAQLKEKPGNQFFSPASISTAIAIPYAGARSRTATQMAAAMRYTLEPNDLHPAFGQWMKTLNAKGKPYQLSTANALWGQSGFPWKKDFVQIAQDSYDGAWHESDFVTDAEAARKRINAWASEATNARIPELIAPKILTSDSRLVVTNAIYFKGTWATLFDKNQTQDLPFALAAADKVNVPFLRRKGPASYMEDETVQVLELPYRGNDLSMVILLPKTVDGLAALESKLTLEQFQTWVTGLQRANSVAISIPKFKMSTDYSLPKELAKLGMVDAFTSTADFSGLHDSKKRLSISDVIHKAFVEVNETGTEAAAATAVVIGRASAPPPPKKEITFLADHPFAFAIRDMRSGSVLFLGRVRSPK
jgi:serpin B